MLLLCIYVYKYMWASQEMSRWRCGGLQGCDEEAGIYSYLHTQVKVGAILANDTYDIILKYLSVSNYLFVFLCRGYIIYVCSGGMADKIPENIPGANNLFRFLNWANFNLFLSEK